MVSLHPFTSENSSPPPITLDADFLLNHGSLELKFSLNDPKKMVTDSLQDGEWDHETLVRKNDLWRTTCFEAFWSLPNEKKYWELNLSGSGEWNIYSFLDYRTPQPPRENNEFKIKHLSIKSGLLICEMSTRVNLSRLDISLCSVIKTKKSEIFYYSNHHAGEKADFHLRQNFSITRGS